MVEFELVLTKPNGNYIRLKGPMHELREALTEYKSIYEDEEKEENAV